MDIKTQTTNRRNSMFRAMKTIDVYTEYDTKTWEKFK